MVMVIQYEKTRTFFILNSVITFSFFFCEFLLFSSSYIIKTIKPSFFFSSHHVFLLVTCLIKQDWYGFIHYLKSNSKNWLQVPWQAPMPMHFRANLKIRGRGWRAKITSARRQPAQVTVACQQRNPTVFAWVTHYWLIFFPLSFFSFFLSFCQSKPWTRPVVLVCWKHNQRWMERHLPELQGAANWWSNTKHWMVFWSEKMCSKDSFSNYPLSTFPQVTNICLLPALSGPFSIVLCMIPLNFSSGIKVCPL